MERTKWILNTGGDIQGRVRKFLAALWGQLGLEGMVVPHYAEEGELPGMMLLRKVAELEGADVFIPLVRMEGVRLVEELAVKHPAVRLGAVMRSCELRGLVERVQHRGVDLGEWMLIGVDCLASFPEGDYQWRVKKAGGERELTREVLRNVRQGGISADRFRQGCQMCSQPGAEGADVSICVVGLPVKEHALVKVREGGLADRAAMDEITDGRAPEWLVEQHERVMGQVMERHERMKQRVQAGLEGGLPGDVVAWMAHLQQCGECRACLDVCPLYDGQLERGAEAVAEWLMGCVACGFCEDVCPQQLPLTAVIERIVHQMQVDGIPA